MRQFHCEITGISHHKKAFFSLDLDSDNHTIALEEEPDNQYDPNAIKVILDGKHIGYVPAKKCKKVKKILQKHTITETRYVREHDELDNYFNYFYMWYR